MQIRTIDRKQEVPHDGAMCDLLWSDPGAAAAAVCIVTVTWFGRVFTLSLFVHTSLFSPEWIALHL